ncbi:MAG: nucleoside kinase [Myxococcales bacterium]|nr:nucleoside kinase [Myxococcales bacterium]
MGNSSAPLRLVAQRVVLPGGSLERNSEIAKQIEIEMRQLAEQNLPLRAEYWTVEEALSYFAECGWAGACQTLEAWRNDAVPLSSYGGVYVIQSGHLADCTGKLKGFGLLPQDDGLLLVYGEEALGKGAQVAPQAPDIATRVSQHADAFTSEHERWLEALEIRSVGEFNRACLQGDVSQLIRVAEGFHEKRIGQIADAIRERVPFPRVVCIAGPSSSGKSTFIRRLKVQLQVNGIRPVGLGLDNYYVDRLDTPLDSDGKLDYEAFDAIRTKLLQQHLEALLRGERVATARYDFETGQSLPSGGPLLELEPRTLLMMEGIQGLNPRLLKNLPSESVFRIFICPLAQLPFDRVTRTHASDLRLLRRIVRDRHSRGATAADTIARWPSVRRGERAHIFPHQGNADAVFDSSLIYEISVLRGFAERYLLEVPRDRPEYTTAHRLIGLVNRFVTIYPEHVPPTSFLREFVGGSGFEY